jgi:hypothetical protein
VFERGEKMVGGKKKAEWDSILLITFSQERRRLSGHCHICRDKFGGKHAINMPSSHQIRQMQSLVERR